MECTQTLRDFFAGRKDSNDHSSKKGGEKTMKMNKAILGIVAATSILSIGVGAANADTIGSFSATQASPLVTFTGGAAGTLSVPNSGNGGVVSFANSNTDGPFLGTTFTFGPITVVGPAITTGATTTEALSGGSFKIVSSTNATLLQGQFTASTLGGNLPTTSASVLSFGATAVTYTGGSFLTDAGFHVGDTGTFSLAMSGLIPGLTTSGSPAYFSGFTVGDATHPGGLTGTFDVTPTTTVPEPATVVPFMLGGLGLFGLIVRKTRQSSSAAA